MAVNLVTRIEFKQYMGISSTNRDSEIDVLIPLVSQLVQTYCRRGITEYAISTPYVQYDNGGTDFILLKETPLKSLLGFSYSTDYGVTWTSMTEDTYFIIDTDKLYTIPQPDKSRNLLKEFKIEYLGRFDPIPGDLKLALFDLIEYYMKNNSAVHVNRDVTPNVTQIQYVATTNFPAHIKRVLDQYVVDYT